MNNFAALPQGICRWLQCFLCQQALMFDYRRLLEFADHINKFELQNGVSGEFSQLKILSSIRKCKNCG
jgi:hypothetical protein